jgi:predicted dehydrogenase
MSILNSALIGYGYAGRTFHAPLLAHTPGLRLAAIVSSQAEAVAHDWPGVTCLADTAPLLADPHIPLVVIATPNHSHYPLARQALLAGKHVVVDKPFTTTVAEALELEALAQQQNRVLSVFHNRRWDADFLTLQHLIQQGTLGRISQFESHFDRFRPQVRERWREQAGVGSGLWFDLGPHLIDQALQLFGRPLTVQADLALQRDAAQTCDYFHVVLGYGQLRVILHGSCLVSGGTPRFSVHGTQASYTSFGLDPQEAALKQGAMPGTDGWGIDPCPGTLFTQRDDVEHASTVPNLAGDYRQYYQALGQCISAGGPNPVSAHQAIAVMTIIEQAQHSADQGRVIHLPQ